MTEQKTCVAEYRGFEQGPIRPPSEAGSLLIRITRNCPWNHCTFCPVYKNERFGLRPLAHIYRDIDQVYDHLMTLVDADPGKSPQANWEKAKAAAAAVDEDQLGAFNAAWNWIRGSGDAIFLQDANSLVIRPTDMIAVLTYLKKRFPWVARITSYARSHSVARISDDDLVRMSLEGLNRIHIGMESGCDRVLKLVRKGSDQLTQIKAGKKVRSAGIQLSEYVMPGLGGRQLSQDHARDTATALNQINPDFIRLRTLAVTNGIPLNDQCLSGQFEKLGDLEIVQEIHTFISHLEGIQSRLVSDHMFNLLQEIEGTLPGDKPKMLTVLERFMDLSDEMQVVYQVGRRLGFMSCLEDLERPRRVAKAQGLIEQWGLTPLNVDTLVQEAVQRFI